METRRKPQLLLSLIVLSVLFSQMSAWPLVEASFVRSARQANDILPSDLSGLLDDFPDKFEVFNEKRDLDNIAENGAPMRRQSDAIFTDRYSRLRKQQAVKKYLESVHNHQKKYGDKTPN